MESLLFLIFLATAAPRTACMSCHTLFLNRQREISVSINPQSVQTVVDAVLCHENQRADFITIEFLSDAKTRNLHKKFFGDSSPTDCMSFPIDLDEHQKPRHLGDIFICPKTALSQAQNNPLIFFEELTLYLVHGILHLLGYDDLIPSARKKMKQHEASIMKSLHTHGQILSGNLQL